MELEATYNTMCELKTEKLFHKNMFKVNTDVSADSSAHDDIIIYFYLQSIEYECAQNKDRTETAEKG